MGATASFVDGTSTLPSRVGNADDRDVADSFTVIDRSERQPDVRTHPKIHMEVVPRIMGAEKPPDGTNRLIIGGVEVNPADYDDYPTEVDAGVNDTGPRPQTGKAADVVVSHTCQTHI